MYITGPEKALFYFLAALSVAAMFWQIALRVRLWRKGRPIEWATSGPDGRLYGIPTRAAFREWARNVGVYVLAQKKVRESRKRSGAPMHLAIFYGFSTLLLATTLLGINTYSPVNFHKGTYFLVYEMTADVMGAVFVIGVGWAFVRRLVSARRPLGAAALAELPTTDPGAREIARQGESERRRPLTSAPADYFALGLLFALGLTGYWLEASRMSNRPRPFDWSAPVGWAWSRMQGYVPPAAYKAIWWLHALLVFAFFVVLPRLRLRHILIGAMSAAGRPETPMGVLRPVTEEEVVATEKVGAALASDFSRWHLMSLDACMECGRCTEVCPAWAVGKVLNPKQVVQDVRAALAGDDPVAARVSEEALWACTTCSACVEACPVLIRHVDLIVDARRNLVSEGRLSGPAATMLRQTASTASAWGRPAADREEWMKGLDVPLCRDGVEFDYLFWVGCAGATDPGAIKTTRAVAELLGRAGVKFACLGREESCTGDPARRVGEEFLFQDMAGRNVSAFQKYGVRKVVTPCPHCFNTLAREYANFGAELEVVHHSQLLARLAEEGALRPASTAEGGTTYHDPCYLARINDEAEAPRVVLGPVEEPVDRGRKTLCCGAGGGRMWMEESPSQRPSVRRAEQLLATGAKTVAVGCPFCRIMLGDALRQARPNEEIRLIDLAEAMRDANGPVG